MLTFWLWLLIFLDSHKIPIVRLLFSSMSFIHTDTASVTQFFCWHKWAQPSLKTIAFHQFKLHTTWAETGLLVEKPRVWFVLGESKHLLIHVSQSLSNTMLLFSVLIFACFYTACLVLHKNDRHVQLSTKELRKCYTTCETT